MLTTPNGTKLEQALAQLDLHVAIDIYQNETSRLADYILPPTTSLEQSHFDFLFNALATRNIVRYSPTVVAIPEGSYEGYRARPLASTLGKSSGISLSSSSKSRCVAPGLLAVTWANIRPG